MRCQSYISFSFDDPKTTSTEMFDYKTLNDSLLIKLNRYDLKASLFVCGKRIDTQEGADLIRTWDSEGHSIANHSYDHRNYGSTKMSFSDFKADFEKNLILIQDYVNYKKRFRFPYLKEGDTREKIDSCRDYLFGENYANGYVSIDASDWYIDQVMQETLKVNPSADLRGFREFYVYHILERSRFYDSLATELTGRKIKHVLLLHHNLLNSLFLEDLISALKENNYILTDTETAYLDPIYSSLPDCVPAGESIVWSLAKESGKFEDVLRYPAEDSPYEEFKLNHFLKKY